MKQFKRIAALALALIMVLGLATTAFAVEDDGNDTPETIEISVTTSASGAPVAGHTYDVYQIFKGTVAEDGKTLSNAAFGANYAPANTTVDAAMKDLENRDAEDAADFLVANKTGDPIATLKDSNDHKASVVPGYYLIIDVTENLPDQETASAYILEVLEPIAIQSKHDKTPITYKKIDDINDSTGEGAAIEWHDSADHDIGDLIDFQLNAELPVSFDIFRTKNVAYPFTFHDVEEAGLTFQSISRVYVVTGGVETNISADQYTLKTDPTDGCTFEVIFSDLTQVPQVVGGSRIVAEYKSRLNEQAVPGNQGNLNSMRGEFINYHNPEHPDYTPWDSVIAFTYKVVVNKVDEDRQALAGAEFTLEKLENGTWISISKVETEPGTTFTFKGLDDGKYHLTETDTPDGYNSIEPIEFEVTAEHEIAWEEWEGENRKQVLTTLTGDVLTGDITFNAIDDKNAEGEVVFEKTGLSADVVNQAGVILPETGGIGTTIFYVVGAAMVLVAVVLLVTKKRMASAE